ncbi:hypothetical protein DICPUDRAFT_98893 [Dictyostelium purpureum]|uniref:Uncharacterized protein n=1 Tax=Dictyostelium purpureum TaxID=5786 RepID=F0ZUI7_DICPU|nr:uncharacterized protein DICPUDRAFT_98893 [Dictyostelium purpureum]EGC32400.1 hypothetical protein DICPUDRAFT_98893 [Dictyostelium purpureum]|eukprot:XP_003291086.1 hypothetical protein DICPUDRAFT_98893 [Dictyostelium purpureum]
MEIINNKFEDLNQNIIGNKRCRDSSSGASSVNNNNYNNNSFNNLNSFNNNNSNLRNKNNKNKLKNQQLKKPQKNQQNNIKVNSIELPIYLQKYIIKLLINEINRKDKNHDYYKMIPCEKRFKCKILSIAMVNWDWFKTVSNNLYCANDNFNYKTKSNQSFSLMSNYQLYSHPSTEMSNKNNNKFSLIKEENIKVLRLTQVYCKEYCREINEKIKKFANLKKIILSSTFTSADDWYLFTEHIDLGNYKIDINCDIHDIYEHDAPFLTPPCKLNVSLLNIWSDFDEECELVALEYIKYFRPKKLLLFPTSNIIQFSKGYELFINNQLNNNRTNITSTTTTTTTTNNNGNGNSNNNNILSFKELNYYEPITVEELYYLMKSSPNIKNLSFQICYDTLIYYLSEKRTKPCVCNTPISVHTGDDSTFYQHWQFIHSSILNHKHLTSLSITHRCPESYELNQFYTGNYQNEKTFPIQFIENFGSMILFNKSLKSLKLSGIHVPSIFEYIIKGSITSNLNDYTDQHLSVSNKTQGNKRILKFKSEFINTLKNEKEYIESIDNLLKENPPITKFYLHEINYVGDYLKKNYLTFKCIYKSLKKNIK